MVWSATENLIGPPGGGVQATTGVLPLSNSATGITIAAAMSCIVRTGGFAVINAVPVPRASGARPFEYTSPAHCLALAWQRLLAPSDSIL